MKFHFTAEHDAETGELGWKDSRIDDRHSPYGPLSYAYGLAHDTIDHIGLETIADEIMAHAAMYWSRYQGGHVTRNGYTLQLEHIGQEWMNMARAMMDGHTLEQCPRTTKLDDSTEEDISTIIEAGRKNLREEIEEGWKDYADDIEKSFRGWFRIGYRNAAKRWARWGMGPGDVGMLYEKVAALFEKKQPEWEGEEVTLSITKNSEIRLLEAESEVY